MPEELSRHGHRQRVKDLYLKNRMTDMPPHQLLELILFYAIPRRDVKETAYALLNHFDGKIERVFRADIRELQKVSGIGENAAILISLFDTVSHRIMLERNADAVFLGDYAQRKEYAVNALSSLKNERVIMVTLDNQNRIISSNTVAEGTVNRAGITPKKIVEIAIKDNAAAVLLAHNHPEGTYQPSEDDVVLTAQIYAMLNTIDVQLVDHIIVGERGALSMNNDARFVKCFM